MITIAQMLGFPNGTPIDRAQAKVLDVYERKTVAGKDGPTSVQNAMLTDIGGQKIKMVVWGHDDIAMYKGKEIIVEGRNGKGLGIKHGSYTNKSGETVNTIELNVSRTGTIQPLEVFKAHNPAVGVQTPAPAQNPANAPQSAQNGAPGVVHGAKVGMAINNAVLLMTEQGVPYSKQNLFQLAAEIIEVSNALEQGQTPKVVEPPKPQEAAPKSAPATKQGADDEDVPF